MTHLCVSKLTSIVSDNGLSPGRRQAIIWNNAGNLLIGPLGTNFSEILIEIPTFSLTKIRLKMSSAKWRLFCLGLNVLIGHVITYLAMLPALVISRRGQWQWNSHVMGFTKPMYSALGSYERVYVMSELSPELSPSDRHRLDIDRTSISNWCCSKGLWYIGTLPKISSGIWLTGFVFKYPST